jgi:hypothetical protein
MAGLSHAQAHDVVVAAWQNVHGREPSAREALYAQAIAFLESGYGRAGQFGTLAARGQYNWGALERRVNADGSCPDGFALGVDQGQVCFYVFSSDVDAATAFVRTLTKGHWPVLQAMQGTPEDVAAAMRVPPPYYAGTASTEAQKVADYATAIRNAIKSIGTSVPGPVSAAGRGILLPLAVVSGLAYLAYRNRRSVERWLARRGLAV